MTDETVIEPLPERIGSRPRSRSMDSEESGFTLIELIIAMGVFLIFATILLTAVIGLTRSTARVQFTSQSTGESLVVFQNLDRQIRYADAINLPGDGASGARYVEFHIPAASTPDRIARCTQWRFVRADGRIQSRQWDADGGAVPGEWTTKLTSSSDVPDADYPFKVLRAGTAGSARQQLVLRIETGRDGQDGGTAIRTSFVARNSSTESVSNTDANSDGASDNPVCLAAGGRP